MLNASVSGYIVSNQCRCMGRIDTATVGDLSTEGISNIVATLCH